VHDALGDVGANEDFIATVVFPYLSARVAVDVPSADGLIVADAVQLVERVPSHACHELLVHVARGRHVETHVAPADCAVVRSERRLTLRNSAKGPSRIGNLESFCMSKI
jgi:hypothetical protein